MINRWVLTLVYAASRVVDSHTRSHTKAPDQLILNRMLSTRRILKLPKSVPRSEGIIRVLYLRSKLPSPLHDVASMVWQFIPTESEPTGIKFEKADKMEKDSSIEYIQEIRPGILMGLDTLNKLYGEARTVIMDSKNLGSPRWLFHHEKARRPVWICFCHDIMYYLEDIDDRWISRQPISADAEPLGDLEIPEFLVPDEPCVSDDHLVFWQPTRSWVYVYDPVSGKWDDYDVFCSVANLDARVATKPIEFVFIPSNGLFGATDRVVLFKDEVDDEHVFGRMWEKKMKRFSPDVVKYCPAAKDTVVVAFVDTLYRGYTVGIGLLNMRTGCFLRNVQADYIAGKAMTVTQDRRVIMMFGRKNDSEHIREQWDRRMNDGPQAVEDIQDRARIEGRLYSMTFSLVTATEGYTCENCGKAYKRRGNWQKHLDKCRPAPLKDRNPTAPTRMIALNLRMGAASCNVVFQMSFN
ncbi:hypothetical protein FOZ61_006941 [Perkinsus olseni]|uniref:C2H2-type domain-containing protein n=1 Tax=Perkinsus olseni TaxID=32597 RepID=A0A7J6LBD9_PEROL|nr:hypothetical protein FOZ61_006941 [Perkinsus olseni]